MANYVVYDPSTGDIKRSGVCSDSHVALQAGPDEKALATDKVYSDVLYRVLEGNIVKQPAKPKPSSPTAYVRLPSAEQQLEMIFNEGIEGWRAKIAAIKAANPK
jgi:hypothetical protein